MHAHMNVYIHIPRDGCEGDAGGESSPPRVRGGGRGPRRSERLARARRKSPGERHPTHGPRRAREVEGNEGKSPQGRECKTRTCSLHLCFCLVLSLANVCLLLLVVLRLCILVAGIMNWFACLVVRDWQVCAETVQTHTKILEQCKSHR